MDKQRHSALLSQIKPQPPLDDYERLCDAIGFGPHTHIKDRRDLVEKAEAEIARRGLLGDYVGHLEALMGLNFSFLDEELYNQIGQVVTAPPAARARAMLRVLEERREHTPPAQRP